MKSKRLRLVRPQALMLVAFKEAYTTIPEMSAQRKWRNLLAAAAIRWVVETVQCGEEALTGMQFFEARREDALSQATTTAHVIETGESPFAVSIEVSGHSFVGDEPLAEGGSDLGPAPYDLLLAALGECTAMTVRWYARQQNWPLERVEVTLTYAKGGVEGKSAKADHFAKTIRISGEDLTKEQRDKLIAVAARCPVQRTLEGTPVITTNSVS